MSYHFRPRDPRQVYRENALLREQVRQLREALTPTLAMPAAWKLTDTQARFLSAIRKAAPNILTLHSAMSALYSKRAKDWPEDNNLRVHMTRMRRRLAEANSGVVILSVPHAGWTMPPDSVRAFDARFDREAQQ